MIRKDKPENCKCDVDGWEYNMDACVYHNLPAYPWAKKMSELFLDYNTQKEGG